MPDFKKSGVDRLNDRFIYLDIVLVVFLVIGLSADIFHLLPAKSSAYFLIFLSIVGTLPVVANAAKALYKRRLTIDLLASIALIFSLIARAWYSAAFINLMIASARIFERYTANRARHIIHALLKNKPIKAKIQVDHTVKIVLVENIKAGDLVVIESGDQLPIDGLVVSGQGAINQAILTGESEPVLKKVGDRVFSGTVNESGSLVVKAEKLGEETAFAKIVRLVDAASRMKTAEESVADKFVAWYIGLALIGSTAIFIATKNIDLVLSLLLVVCADDIAVSIPLTFTGAITRAAHEGAIVKGAVFLETISRIQTIITDKTGTLTRGKPQVTAVEPIKMSEEKFLKMLGTAETYSKHPTAKAVLQYLKSKNIAVELPEKFEEIPGEGICVEYRRQKICAGKMDYLEKQGVRITAELKKIAAIAKDSGASITSLGVNEKFAGIIFFEDQLRPFAQIVVKHTKEFGVKRWVMITGDNEKVAARVAKDVGIDIFKADLKPEDKVAIIAELKKEYGQVAMIGDGVNDAAALAAADLSIAMGAIGSDAAIEAADIALMSDNLRVIPKLMDLSKIALKIVNQDFWIWGITNTVGIFLVLLGVLGPIGAAVFNFVTDFLPITNSLRIIRIRLKHREV
ncbi:MAG: cation-translocating P-type ATPase [Patescibacteria group bacterium]|nr:cation-translocating P-type ATPase [Patescibacteria group bacterium]MCL5262059.1 cation-translocating P-type ATPase [Patescibacteria group bacterium]